jgi:hypothetical protein
MEDTEMLTEVHLIDLSGKNNFFQMFKYIIPALGRTEGAFRNGSAGRQSLRTKVVPPPQGCKDRNEVEPGGGPTQKGNAQILSLLLMYNQNRAFPSGEFKK